MVNIEAEKKHLDLKNGKVGDDERVEKVENGKVGVENDEELGDDKEVNFFCFGFVLHYQQLFEVFHKWSHRNDHN